MTPAGPSYTIIDALEDPDLLRAAFQPPETWAPWKAFLRSIFALPLAPWDLDIFTACTKRDSAPSSPVREVWGLCGRRAGKSRVAALVSVYLAAFKSYALAPGETPVVMVLAADRSQAKVVLSYIDGLLASTPMLEQMVASRSAESIELTNGARIEVHANSFRSVRGRTLVAAICDEICFWRSEDSANPDAEVIAALRPALSTVPGSLLVAISSPHARQGIAHAQFEKCFGKNDERVLIWRAPTTTMNPGFDQAIVEAALADDDVAARSEYLAEWRSDLERFVTMDILDKCIVQGVVDRPHLSSNTYYAFVDVSGGSHDSAVLGISHTETRDELQVAVVDVLREMRAPFDPEVMTKEFAAVLTEYRCSSLSGDKYAAQWPVSAFKRFDIQYEPIDKTRSDLYRELLPRLRSRSVELPDSKRLRVQLCSLERRVSRSGAELIDHGPAGHDDVANAAAGAAYLALKPRNTFQCWSPGDYTPSPATESPDERWLRVKDELRCGQSGMLTGGLLRGF